MPERSRVENLTCLTYGVSEDTTIDFSVLKLEELEFKHRFSRTERLCYSDADYFDFLKIRLVDTTRLINSKEVILDLRSLNEKDLVEKQGYIQSLVDQLDSVKKFLKEKFNFVCKEEYKSRYHILENPILERDKRYNPIQPLKYKANNIDKENIIYIAGLMIDEEDREFIRENYNLLESQSEIVKMPDKLGRIGFLQRCRFIYTNLYGESENAHEFHYVFGLIKILKDKLIRIHGVLGQIYESRFFFQEKSSAITYRNFREMTEGGQYNRYNNELCCYQFDLQEMKNQYREYRKYWIGLSNVIKIGNIDDPTLRVTVRRQINCIKDIDEFFDKINSDLDKLDFHQNSKVKTLEQMIIEDKKRIETRKEEKLQQEIKSTMDQLLAQIEIEEEEEKRIEAEREEKLEMEIGEAMNMLLRKVDINVANANINIPVTQIKVKIQKNNAIDSEVKNIEKQSLQNVNEQQVPPPVISNTIIEETNIIVRAFKKIINFLSCHRLFLEMNGPSNE